MWWEPGCLDGLTEFLSPLGWVPLREWNGHQVAQWDQKTGHATFVDPVRYIVGPCEQVVVFRGKYIPTQVLSPGHRMPTLTRRGEVGPVRTAIDMATHLEKANTPICLRVPSQWTLEPGGPGTGLSEAQLRVQVAVMADGHFPKQASTCRCVVRLKKPRKISRLRMLLTAAGIDAYERDQPATGFTIFSFDAPRREKRIASFWTEISASERDIISDEAWRWDGCAANGARGMRFFSTHERDCDFIQFVWATQGKVTRKALCRGLWTVSVRGTHTKGYVLKPRSVSYARPEGGLVYCFEVPTGFFIARRGGAVFPTGNCGKSKSVIDAACHLMQAGKIDGMFVLAPSGVQRAWISDELPLHAWVEFSTMLWETRRRRLAAHRGAFEELLTAPGLAVLAMTYDAMRTEDGAKSAKRFLEKRKCLYVADETTRIANPAAKITRRALASAKYAPFRRALNGTPVSDSPFKAYSQVRFVDPEAWASLGIKTFAEFKGFFGEWTKGFAAGGRNYPKLTGYRNLDRLSRVLAQVGSNVRKEDALDLPPKTYVRRYFDLSDDQRVAYDTLQRELRTEVEGRTLTADGALSLLTRLQQAASGRLPSDDDKTPRAIGDERPRLDLLQETLEEFGVPAKQAIVWARFTFEVDEICERLRGLGIPHARYDGEVSEPDRAVAKQLFQDGTARILVAKAQCAGVGLTLTAAEVAVYYSNLFSQDLREQSENRPHRKGQTRPVTFVDLVANNTVDLRILEVLSTKSDVSASVTSRSWWDQALDGATK